jgi:uncharacterized protein
MIERSIYKSIKSKFGKGKAIILLGARQVGKSTLLQTIFEKEKSMLYLDAEEADVPVMFLNPTSTKLKKLFGKYKILVIDEAQKIENIGSVLKLCTDYLKETQVVVTGSSAFEIRNKTNEPLTGRKWEYTLFPISFAEMVQHTNAIEENRLLAHRVLYGYYPELVINDDALEQRLKLLSDSYLYKDILMWQDIQKPDKLVQILKALSLQIGSELSYTAIGNIVGLKNDTVEKYIDLLEKTFVIYKLPAYSTNQRKELKKGKKIYFMDNGIRNAIIGDFKNFETRQDKGALFENFIISELYKKFSYEEKPFKMYFWRTADQQEIDLIIEQENVLHTFEIKWSPKAKVHLTKTFSKLYPNHTFSVIHSENYMDYIL